MTTRRLPFTLPCWDREWIIRGKSLSCRYCGAVQTPVTSPEPFRHKESCPSYAADGRYPWQELEDLLRADLADFRRKMH